ncbi:hypothetical protein ACK1M2_000006 [Providencia rettgeri]
MMMALFFLISSVIFCMALQAAVIYFSFVAFLFISQEESSLSTCFLKVNAYLGGVAALIGIYFPWTRDNNCRHY